MRIKADIGEIICEAQAGEYHDFKNKKYACGKVAVVGKLQRVGLDALAKRVIQGEFDEVPDAEDKAMMKRDALAGGFTEAQCEKLFGI